MNDIVDRLARVRRQLDAHRNPYSAGAVQAAISEIERLREAIISERHGWQAEVQRLRREGIEAAAREMECGCPDETKAAVLEALRDGHNSVKRWKACGHSQCSTIDAFNIRALLEGGR